MGPGGDANATQVLLRPQVPLTPLRWLMLTAMARRVVVFIKKDDGPTSVEYAIMLALIIVVCVAAVTALGSSTNAVFGNVTLKNALDTGS
jgi:pilus assembly protein Flp/PilA